MTQTLTELDGSTAFDPLFGRWHVHNRKLRDILDPDCTEWVQFAARVECRPILDGSGNIDFGTFHLDPPFEGFTLRLYDPQSGLWRIWWTSTRQPGELDIPVEGRFTNGTGLFECEQT